MQVGLVKQKPVLEVPKVECPNSDRNTKKATGFCRPANAFRQANREKQPVLSGGQAEASRNFRS